ncbi:MAG: T9SS type A sorting domain-containing protein [Candidatus Syntrophosphaera sp.]|nr:T9SS type A sorting domain-containing protein [Candidatus Syntrophosphaera sp.]
MKKMLLSLALVTLLAWGALSAEGGREVWVFEDFSSGTFPPAGWTISNNAANWSAYAGATAGGESPELRFSWTPQFTGTSYFISPSFDTSGETTLLLDFKHFVDHYTNPYTIGVATRSNSGDWNTVWSQSPTGNVGPLTQTVTISNADVGSSTFQFALYFNGNSYNIDYWYIDDIKLYTPFPYDLAIIDASLPVQTDAGTQIDPACTVKNSGLNSLTATVSLSIYRGDVLEATHPDYYSAYLNGGESQTAGFPAFIPAWPDELYRFVFSVSSLEDVVDDDPSNNQLEAYVNTWTGAKQMVVLEIGTGGWCPYCPGAAMAADDFIDLGYNVAVIENHNGDPYANDTSNFRNSYYGISGYPTGFFDGVLSHVGGSNTTSVFPQYFPLYQQRNAVKTPVNIEIFGEQTRENYLITIRVDKFAPVAYPNLVMHLAITESDIAYNWQGQDHFNFVNRMMYPTYDGTPIDLINWPLGTSDVVLAISKEASWVTANCELVAFIQNVDSKEIIQANKVAVLDLEFPPVANNDPGASPVLTALGSSFPNPFSGQTTIAYTLAEKGPVSIEIYNVKGQLVRTLISATKAGGSHSTVWNGRDNNGKQAANGTYIVRMKSGNQVSTRRLMLLK